MKFGARQTWRIGGTLVLAAIAAPTFPQPVSESGTDAQRQLLENIQEVQSQGGPHSRELVGPLTALALSHEEHGDRASAIAAIEQARQVVRANYGLSSIEELPLLRQLVQLEEARGNVEAAWDLEQELLTLVRQYPDDLRVVPVLREIADKRTDVLDRYFAGGFPPQIVLGCYYDEGPHPVLREREWRNCHAGSITTVIGKLLGEAQSFYTHAIDILLRNDGNSRDEVDNLVLAVLRNSYRYREYRVRGYSAAQSSGPYYGGAGLLRRVLTHESAASEPSARIVDRLVQMADWDILSSAVHGERVLAAYGMSLDSVLETYQVAYDLLIEEGAEQAAIDRIFSPETPVVLPAFLPNPLVTEESSEAAGYIDIAFDITKYGEGENVEILETTTNSTRSAERDVVDLIERSSFRPRVTDGEVADAARVLVRYYLGE